MCAAGPGVVVAAEKKMNRHNTVREMLRHRYIQGSLKNQGRAGEPVQISDRKESLPAPLGARKNFPGDVTVELSLERTMGQPPSVCRQTAQLTYIIK